MPSKRNLSIVARALSADLREAIALARSMGFGGLVFDAHSPSLNLPELSGTGRREFSHLLRTNAQTLVAIRADIGPKGFAPAADLDRLLSGLDGVLHVARDLNAGCVTIDLGPLPEAIEEAKPKPKVTPEQAGIILIPSPSEVEMDAKTQAAVPTRPADPTLVARIDVAMRALCEIAERYQTRVAMNSSLSNFASLNRALRSVSCPWFGTNLDPIALLHDHWSVDEVFSRFGDSILHVIAKDAIRGDVGRIKPMPVGEGDVPWDSMLAALDAADYREWITVDPSSLPDAPSAIRTAISRLQISH